MTILALACFLVVGNTQRVFWGVTACRRCGRRSHRPWPKARLRTEKAKRTSCRWRWRRCRPPDNLQLVPEPLRQAFASDSPFSPQPPKVAAPSSMPLPADKPKAAAKPAIQKSLRAAQRHPDRRHQGAPETVAGAGAALARRRKRATRHREKDPRHPPGQSQCRRRTDRSRQRRGQAVEDGSDAAAVPATRRPEARSPHALPHHRTGSGSLAPRSSGRFPPVRGCA